MGKQMMSRKFSVWDEMCENILSANTEQMVWLMKRPGFDFALTQISSENWVHMSEAKFDMLLPHLNIGPELLAEAAHWLSINDQKYQTVAQKLIKTHTQSETSSSHNTLLQVNNAVFKYNQTPSDPIMKRFAQAYEDQHSIQQGKRIAAELPHAKTSETVKPTKTRRKL